MNHLGGKTGKSAFIVGLALIAVLSLCGLAFCGGGAEHGAAHEGDGKLVDLGARAINFALMVLILFLALRKTPLKDFFSRRTEEIKQKFEELRRDKETAENRYAELERKLKEFEVRKKEIIEQFKAEGAAEKEKIIEEARRRAKQILDQADLTIQRELQAARDSLQKEVLDLAARKAEEIIAKEIRDSDQDKLVDEFIERVEKLH